MRTHTEIATDPEKSERAAVAAHGAAVVACSLTCPICGTPLTGRKTSACSDRCRAAKSWRNRVPLPATEARAIRTQLTAALEMIYQAKATLEDYGGGRRG